jgi:sugar phosphate isomerase/epimerase
LRAVREAGFAATQFNMACVGLSSMPDSIPEAAARSVAEAARTHGVEIVAVSGTYNMIHPDRAVRAKGLVRLGTIAGACAAIGTRMITLCTGTRDPEDQWRHHRDNASDAAWRDLLVEMEAAIGIAERFDVELGIEPELANVVSSAAKARRLIDELGSPRLRIVLDAANLFERESVERQRRLVTEAIDRLADRITMAHAKDRTASGDFTAAGNGVLDYVHYLGELRRAGFDGPLVTHGLNAAEAAAVARFLSGFIDPVDVELSPDE